MIIYYIFILTVTITHSFLCMERRPVIKRNLETTSSTISPEIAKGLKAIARRIATGECNYNATIVQRCKKNQEYFQCIMQELVKKSPQHPLVRKYYEKLNIFDQIKKFIIIDATTQQEILENTYTHYRIKPTDRPKNKTSGKSIKREAKEKDLKDFFLTKICNIEIEPEQNDKGGFFLIANILFVDAPQGRTILFNIDTERFEFFNQPFNATLKKMNITSSQFQ